MTTTTLGAAARRNNRTSPFFDEVMPTSFSGAHRLSSLKAAANEIGTPPPSLSKPCCHHAASRRDGTAPLRSRALFVSQRDNRRNGIWPICLSRKNRICGICISCEKSFFGKNAIRGISIFGKMRSSENAYWENQKSEALIIMNRSG